MTLSPHDPFTVLKLLKEFDRNAWRIDAIVRGKMIVEAQVLLDANFKTPAEIATNLGLKPSTVKSILEKYAKIGVVKATVDGKYYVPENTQETIRSFVKTLVHA
jgi:Mn-dependent DtxR family transcriptional regulator